MRSLARIYSRGLTVSLISALVVLIIAAPIAAQNSAFTFQGKLNDGGSPTNTSFDMRFRLFDSLSVGTQIGPTVTVTDVATSAGIFTLQLDFGAASFTGGERWIELSISLAGQDNYVTLAPRQKLTSAPYAVQSLNAMTATDSLNLGGVPANQFVLTADPRLSDARVPLPGSNDYLQNNPGAPQSGANFSIGGTGSANIINADTQFELAGQRVLSTPGNGNVFVGAGAGAAEAGIHNTFVGKDTGLNHASGSSNSFFGYNAGSGSASSNGNSIFGAGSGVNTTGSTNSFFGVVTAPNNTTGFFNSMFGGNAGINNTTGNANVFVGVFAGLNNTTGSSNTFIGTSAGPVSTDTQVNNSTAIGAGARVSTSNTIVLGTGSQTTIAAGSFTTNGSLIARANQPGAQAPALEVAQSQIGGSVITNNLYIRQFNELAAPSHLCWRPSNVGVPALVVTNCTSPLASAQFKTDSRPFTGGLEIIKRLNPIGFKWRSSGEREVGLNAEDVAAVEPSLVTRNARGEIEDVREHSLNVVFINAIKEQQKQIETQQEQIRRQQKEIDSLKKIICVSHTSAEICREDN